MPFCANEFGRINSMLCFFNLSSFCFLNQCLTMMLEFINLSRLTGYNVQEFPCFLLPSTGITISPRIFTWLSAIQTQVHVSVCQPFFYLVLSSANNSGKPHLFTLDFFLVHFKSFPQNHCLGLFLEIFHLHFPLVDEYFHGFNPFWVQCFTKWKKYSLPFIFFG